MEGFDSFETENQFNYSALELDSLGATEYTIVNILCDESGSVCSFENELEDAMKEVFESCKKHPRSENLLLRAGAFSSTTVRELFGFSTLDTIDPDNFDVNPGGGTPLYQATLEAVDTMGSYARVLNDQDFFCNGILFVLTDGCENHFNIPISKIKDAVQKLREEEALESITLVLVGVNDNGVHAELDKYKNEAGFDEYISLGDVDAGKLAKLAKFISDSISSTSQALGSGGPSQAVNFTL